MRCTSRPLQTTARTLLVRASALSSSSRLQQAQAMASGGGNAAIAEAADRGAASPQPGAKPKVIVVTGPTAVGKTKIGLEIAKRLGGEVISADSVQVYTGLDVGSDKVRGRARMVAWMRLHTMGHRHGHGMRCRGVYGCARFDGGVDRGVDGARAHALRCAALRCAAQ